MLRARKVREGEVKEGNGEERGEHPPKINF